MVSTVLAVFLWLGHAPGMRCPSFRTAHRLSDWPDCVLEIRCPCSERMIMLPVRMLLQRGDRTFSAVLRALRCSRCRGGPAPVYLVNGHHRTFNHGPEPDWAVELVPVPL